ncbi:MAG: HAD family hydrolase [Bacteroidales bacterium]|nr:HAD family hydrolase [Bacteroidales bacterium]
MNLKDLKVDKSWTLFLDRDGVINVRLIDDYVKTPDDFKFIDGVPKAIRHLSAIFGRIIIVTNQQGIGKGLMTESELKKVHNKMLARIIMLGGKIDRIYYSPFKKEENDITRKPQIGMALQARKEFPEINFKKSIMIGDSISDIIFGKKLNMKTVFVSNDLALINKNFKIIDLTVNSLYEFSEIFNK